MGQIDPPHFGREQVYSLLQIEGVLLVINTTELKHCRNLIKNKTVVEDLTRLENPEVDLAEIVTAIT